MSHEIDTTNGVSSFASFREPAWHGLGTVFDNEVTEYDEMLKLAGLGGWDVRLVPVVGVGRSDKETFEIVRTNPVDAGIDRLGFAGERRAAVQNETALSVLQDLATGTGTVDGKQTFLPRWETAGAIKDGRVVFGSLSYEREFVIDPSGVGDIVKSFLLAYIGHDGSTPWSIGITPVRVVGNNTLNVAVRNLSNTIKCRQTKTVEDRMRLAASVWKAEQGYSTAFETEAQALFAAPVTDKQYENYVGWIMGKHADTKNAKTRAENTRDSYMLQWNKPANAGIKGTAWGAWNAVTERNQWERIVQDRDGGREAFYVAGMGLDGPTNAFRQRTLERIKVVAGVKV